MRGSGAAGGGGTATPGARLARLMKLRPFSGRSTIFRLSMTWPSPDVSLRSSGASAVTVTASATPPSLQLQIQPHGFAGGEANALTSQRPEAAQLDAHAIQAGRQTGDHVAHPSDSVTVLRDTFVPAAVIVTVAPETGAPA